MSSSVLSFQGLSTGIQTDALVSAILASEGRAVAADQKKETQNGLRTTALTTMKTNMSTLSVSIAALQDAFKTDTVTSTDVNNAYVTATGVGATPGNYDLQVTSVATRGRLSPTMSGNVPSNLAVADPAAAIFTGAQASFAVEGTDGVVKAFSLSNNSLNGLRDAINASGAGVQATIINSGSGASPYQLVITAKDTGTGTNGGVVSLAAIDNEDGTATSVNPALGITAGSLGLDPADPTTGTFAAPKTLTGGLSSAAATDAVFTINGIQLTRKSNVVTDAASGLTLTLRQGAETGITTLTVAQNKTAATTALQSVVTNFNALVKTYTAAANSTKDANTGAIVQGALSGDSTAKLMVSRIRAALTGVMGGSGSGDAFRLPAAIGLSTQADGTLSLNASTLSTALDKDPNAVANLFRFNGTSTNGSVSVVSGTGKTSTGAITFTIDSYTAGGAVSGTFSGTDAKGVAFNNLRLSGSNGTLIGAAGGPLEGLTLGVTASGSGTLNLTRGPGQAVQDLVASLSASGTGDLANLLLSITNQNKTLDRRIASGQITLAQRKVQLTAQFSQMEVAVAQMKAASGNLSSLG